MKWGGGGGRVNIEWGTLPYPTELKWKVGVKWEGVGVNIGWVTLPRPNLPYGVQVGYKTDQEMKCGERGAGVNIGWCTLPWGGWE